MPKGTNPWYSYTLPFDTVLVDKARFVIRQRDGLKVRKTEKDMDMNGNTVRFRLTQEDTFKLNEKLPAQRQLRIKTTAGDLFKTRADSFTIDGCLDEEVL